MKVKDKRYIILGYNQKENKYYGYVEHSFNMGALEDRIKVYGNFKTRYNEEFTDNVLKSCERSFKSGKTKERPNSYNQHLWFWLRKTVERLNREKYKDCSWRLYRVGSAHCPVIIDFTEMNLMIKGKMKYDKFLYRNQPFKTK